MIRHILLVLFFLLIAPSAQLDFTKEQVEIPKMMRTDSAIPCHANGVVASWCDVTVNPDLECAINPDFDLYACTCERDPTACPSECIGGSSGVSTMTDKQHYAIECQGIPQDEPNYVLKVDAKQLPLHHCENNAIVANWCDEWTIPDVNCLLLTALDEYVCTCHDNAAACPDDCVGGTAPDKKTRHGIRCKGIPLDQPNYILKSPKQAKQE
jgi:hypothetical protein